MTVKYLKLFAVVFSIALSVSSCEPNDSYKINGLLNGNFKGYIYLNYGEIRDSDFSVHTRSKTLPYFIADNLLILETAKELLYQEKLENSVRLLGISLSNLNTEKKEKVSVQLKFDF